jgi:hypothetical protein
MMITRMYSRASILAAALLLVALGGCGSLKRIFDPVQDPGPLIALEPKFTTLHPRESVEMTARVVDEPNSTASFTFAEDSAGRTVQLVPEDGTRVMVTAVAPGQAIVTATHDKDEGLAVVTVVEQP